MILRIRQTGYSDNWVDCNDYRSIVSCVEIELVQKNVSLYQEYRCIQDRYNRGLTVGGGSAGGLGRTGPRMGHGPKNGASRHEDAVTLSLSRPRTCWR
jgi:hypothetical protein